MLYPYRHERRGDEIRYPLLEITVFTTTEEVPLMSIVDSGAEHTVFHSDVAERLGFDVTEHPKAVLEGVGGVEDGHMIRVGLRLGRHQWDSNAIFTDGVKPGSGLLGQRGFFEFFKVTFDYQERAMDIRRKGVK